MKIEIVKVGFLECNCYLLNIDGYVLVIDPGDEADKICNVIGDRMVDGIIVTHHHFDHDGAVRQLVNKYHVLVYDRYNLDEGINSIGHFSFSVIYTPGHKDDLITIYFAREKIMFCGDFIFKNDIGRTDLPGGNMHQMMESINKLKKYNHDIIIYPGHGDSTSIGDELVNNVYFK